MKDPNLKVELKKHSALSDQKNDFRVFDLKMICISYSFNARPVYFLLTTFSVLYEENENDFFLENCMHNNFANNQFKQKSILLTFDLEYFL